MLSELVANNPSHSQQEADCRGLSSQPAVVVVVVAGVKSRSETCGKLEMWNNDFYWALSKQTHIRLDPGPHACIITLFTTHMEIFNNPLPTSVDEEHNQPSLKINFLSCSRNTERGTSVKGA